MNGSRFLAVAIILAALLVCAGMVVGAMLVRSMPPPATNVQFQIPEGFLDRGEDSAVVVIEPGRMVYLDNSGRLFDIAFPPDEAPYIKDIYSITCAPKRHAANPSRRFMHGYYLDSLAGERESRIEVARRAFIEAAEGRNLQLALDAAERLAELAEHPFLQNQLDTPGYAGRRAAALALAKRGYMETVPILIPLLRDMRLEIRSAAAEYLRKITGKDFVEDIEMEAQDSAIKKYNEWWENYQAGEKKK